MIISVGFEISRLCLMEGAGHDRYLEVALRYTARSADLKNTKTMRTTDCMRIYARDSLEFDRLATGTS